MTDDLDRAVIEAAEAVERAQSQAWAEGDLTEMCKAISESLSRLYDAVKARRRARRPPRLDVIRETIRLSDEHSVDVDHLGLLIEWAISKWEQEQ